MLNRSDVLRLDRRAPLKIAMASYGPWNRSFLRFSCLFWQFGAKIEHVAFLAVERLTTCVHGRSNFQDGHWDKRQLLCINFKTIFCVTFVKRDSILEAV